MVGGITLVFLAAVAFLFWLTGLTGEDDSPSELGDGASTPAPATSGAE